MLWGTHVCSSWYNRTGWLDVNPKFLTNPRMRIVLREWGSGINHRVLCRWRTELFSYRRWAWEAESSPVCVSVALCWRRWTELLTCVRCADEGEIITSVHCGDERGYIIYPVRCADEGERTAKQYTLCRRRGDNYPCALCRRRRENYSTVSVVQTKRRELTYPGTLCWRGGETWRREKGVVHAGPVFTHDPHVVHAVPASWPPVHYRARLHHTISTQIPHNVATWQWTNTHVSHTIDKWQETSIHISHTIVRWQRTSTHVSHTIAKWHGTSTRISHTIVKWQ